MSQTDLFAPAANFLRPPAPSPMRKKYVLKRCAVCDSVDAPFGFGARGSLDMAVRWACREHRSAVASMSVNAKSEVV